MLGQLPKTLNVHGIKYSIRTDYRNIFRILSAFRDKELKDTEKALVCLKRLYEEYSKIPPDDYAEAYKQAIHFIDYQSDGLSKPSPVVVNLEKDEHLIFPAVNKVAGQEVRLMPYLHWWTFVGYFQSIDKDDLFSYVILIRHKQLRHEKLDKSERKFYEANKSMIDLTPNKNQRKSVDDLFAEMMQEAEGRR